MHQLLGDHDNMEQVGRWFNHPPLECLPTSYTISSCRSYSNGESSKNPHHSWWQCRSSSKYIPSFQFHCSIHLKNQNRTIPTKETHFGDGKVIPDLKSSGDPNCPMKTNLNHQVNFVGVSPWWTTIVSFSAGEVVWNNLNLQRTIINSSSLRNIPHHIVVNHMALFKKNKKLQILTTLLGTLPVNQGTFESMIFPFPVHAWSCCGLGITHSLERWQGSPRGCVRGQ